MEIYDNLHGIIEIPDFIKAIIDTKEFQRLRKIKQLGLVYHVFISASHNRFEHSIGVFHLAKKYIEYLEKNNNVTFSDKQKKLVLVGALIHDIGHGPFSHLFDELTESCHEVRSLEIFGHMNNKYDLGYSDEDLEFLRKVIYPTKEDYENEKQKYLFQIVSSDNGVDVDRMDYLLRDIKMTGLNYGVEIYQIMKDSLIIESNQKQQIIIFKDKSYIQVHNFFWVRYILYKNICNHITVRSIEAMIKDILSLIDPILNITKCVENKDWDYFNTITDSIIDTAYLLVKFRDSSKIKDKDKIISLIDRILSRKLYTFKQEIITDSSTIPDTIYDVNKYLFDMSKIKYLSSEKPIFQTKEFDLNKMYFNNDKKINVEYIFKIFETN